MRGLEGTHNGRMLFTAAGEGLVLAHDLRMRSGTRVVAHHNAGVLGLSFEDPYLASASSDGTVLLVNTEENNAGGSRRPPARQPLHTPSGPAYCVDIADQKVVCGSESQVVRVWDFTGAQDAAMRAAAAKEGRGSRKGWRRRAAGGGVGHQNPDASSALLGTSPPALPPVLEGFVTAPSTGTRRVGAGTRASRKQGKAIHDQQQL